MSMCDNSTMHIDQSIETLLSKWACNVSIFTFSLKHVAWSFICIRICVWMIRMKRNGKPTSDWSIERSISRSVEYVTYCCHESDIELYAWKTVNMWVGSIDQSKVSRVYVTTTHTHTSTKYVQSIDGNVKWGSKILCASDRVSIWVCDVVSITDLLTTSSKCIVVHLMHCDHVDKAAARLSNIFESHPNSGPTSCPTKAACNCGSFSECIKHRISFDQATHTRLCSLVCSMHIGLARTDVIHRFENGFTMTPVT
jgi:hypothetical protein